MAVFLRILRGLPLLLLSPLFLLLPALGLTLTDLLWRLFGRPRLAPSRRPSTAAASIVIPNWNGRDLLEKYLPSVLAAIEPHPGSEVIVVENGSTDGSAEFVKRAFPAVRLLELPTNLGFGGGSNAGFRAANNDIVVLLNSDMRVEPDFLAPLLAGFTDENVFAVSCQIFFPDPNKKREETGLTQGRWEGGALRVRHREDPTVTTLYPCFYGGGGSCAFHRAKFLELGGFDELLKPFYLEDTDLGMMAWKRGWKVLYQPASKVWHEHRGTIGRKFSPSYIQSVLKKNFVLFAWKNLHSLRHLAEHFAFAWSSSLMSLLFGDSPERSNFAGLARAFLQLPQAMAARWHARSLAAVDDDEAFARQRGSLYRDRFESIPVPDRLRVLMLAPYPMMPPAHGGAVFMLQTAMELTQLAELHLIILLDRPQEKDDHRNLEQHCASVQYLVRLEGKPSTIASIDPAAVREFANEDLDWLIQRTMFQHRIDVLQIEYTNMGQYGARYRQLLCALFEHDVYFQSVGRLVKKGGGLKTFVEYLRALRWELRMLPTMDHVQMCSESNRAYLLGFAPELAPKLESGLRASIQTEFYPYQEQGREPETILFLGSFRHLPNKEALDWLLSGPLQRIVEARPEARLVIIGSDAPARHLLPPLRNAHGDAIEVVGFVDDIKDALTRYSVFVCPILTGSGVRVKLLEAFACGIPTVSTRIGAEGLAHNDGEFCRLADDPLEFARRVIELLHDPSSATDMARRARHEVEQNWDMRKATRKLEARYRSLLEAKRSPSTGA